MKIGIVGCGVGAHHHIHGIRDVQGAEIIGVCDLNEELAEEFARKYYIKNNYANLSDMLKRGKPDVVHIVTPPKTHSSIAKQIINEGCHVLIEKPMTINTEEADEILRTAEEKKVRLCVMHNHLFDPPILKAKKMISQDIIGDILYVEGKYCLDKAKMAKEGNLDPKHWGHQLPLGIFGEHGLPHMSYLLLSFLENVSSVQACKKQIRLSDNIINGIHVQLEGSNAIGHMFMFDNMEYVHLSIHIYGTKGALHLNMLDLTMSLEKERNLPKTMSQMLVTIEQSFQNILSIGHNIAKITLGKLKRRPGHRVLIQKFYESIQNDSEPPVTGAEGKEVIRVLELIQEQFTEDKVIVAEPL